MEIEPCVIAVVKTSVVTDNLAHSLPYTAEQRKTSATKTRPAKVLSGVVNRFQTCLIILYGIKMSDFDSIIIQTHVCHFHIGVLEYIGFDIADRLKKVNTILRKLFFVVVMGGFQLPF